MCGVEKEYIDLTEWDDDNVGDDQDAHNHADVFPMEVADVAAVHADLAPAGADVAYQGSAGKSSPNDFTAKQPPAVQVAALKAAGASNAKVHQHSITTRQRHTSEQATASPQQSSLDARYK